MIKLLLAIFAAAKAGKILTTAGTMLISVGAYALLYGWRYATGLVLLIFVHEMGHFVAARQKGLEVGAPTFIPFVGAWVALKDTPMNVQTEAYVGLAGPLVGSVGALLCYFLARAYGSPLLLALAYAGFFINLFNLIPLSPFDGGRITAILSPRVWLVGAPMLLALFLWRPSPLLVVMAILAAPQVMKAFRYNPAAPENAGYYASTPEDKLVYATMYIGLAAFLAIMSYDTKAMIEPG
ncbi:MAG: site-2 protease family protein [Alphaproteobacteria bacterium]|nr:site-2 protease family protein [Alphaproteobacteria bacterium]